MQTVPASPVLLLTRILLSPAALLLTICDATQLILCRRCILTIVEDQDVRIASHLRMSSTQPPLQRFLPAAIAITIPLQSWLWLWQIAKRA